MSRSTHLAHLTLASILVASAAASVTLPAQALSCGLPGGGYAVGQDVLVTCSYCSIDDPVASAMYQYDTATGMRLTRHAVEEVQRAALVDGGIALRYRADAPLTVGHYVIDSGSSQMSFVAVADLGLPRLPSVRLVGFHMFEGLSGPIRSALFEVQDVNGLLVVDEGDPDDDPMNNVERTWLSADMETFTFPLGTDVCYSSFPGADYGVRTRVRFGVLAPNGDFSGWTESFDVRYPAADGQYEVDETGALFSVDLETGERTLIEAAPASEPPLVEPAPDEPPTSTEPAPDAPTEPSPAATDEPPIEQDPDDVSNPIDEASRPAPDAPEPDEGSNEALDTDEVEVDMDEVDADMDEVDVGMDDAAANDVMRVPVDEASRSQGSSSCASSRGEPRSGGLVAWALLGLGIAFRRKRGTRSGTTQALALITTLSACAESESKRDVDSDPDAARTERGTEADATRDPDATDGTTSTTEPRSDGSTSADGGALDAGTNVAPDASDASSGGDESDGADRMDGGDSVTGDTVTGDSDDSTSSERDDESTALILKRRFLVGPDGAEQYVAPVYTQYDRACSWGPAQEIDGSLVHTCNPVTAGNVVYLDAECTLPVLRVFGICGGQTGQLVSTSSQAGSSAHLVGEEVAPDGVYSLGASGCLPWPGFTSSPARYYQLEPFPTERLARGTPSIESMANELELVSVESGGARFQLEARHAGYTCWATTRLAPETDTLCVSGYGSTIDESRYYAGEMCTGTEVKVFHTSNDTAPYLVESGTNEDGCYGLLSVRRLGAEVDVGSEVSAGEASGGCWGTRNVNAGEVAFEIGEQLPLDSFPRLSITESGSGRVVYRAWSGSSGTTVQGIGWHDEDYDAPCQPEDVGGGIIRCIPARGNPAGRYADPACTQPLYTRSLDTCVEPSSRSLLLHRSTPGSACQDPTPTATVYELVDYTGPVYFQYDLDQCGLLEGTEPGLMDLGSEVPLSSFVELRFEDRD